MQAIRDILDNDAIAIVLKEREVDAFLRKTKVKPALAITDSQFFLKAGASIPKEIPLTSFTGKELEYNMVAGLDNLPGPITDYALVIQCGACVITRKQLVNRIEPATMADIPVTNYGMAIAYVQGIFERAVAPFVKVEKSSIDYL